MHLLLYIGDSLSTFERISYIIGGVALFLYGIHIMGEALKSLAGNKLKMIIEKTTSTTLKGIITGALMTALIQSSSGTTAIVVALISAGLMSLPQAVSVIMGANIGTTITSIIIGLNISDYSLIIIGVGALMCFFSSRQKITDTGVAILGFGLLFFGLELMGDTLKLYAQEPFFTELMKSFSDSPILGVGVGAIFTAIIQSSSAAIGIIQKLYADTDGGLLLSAAIPLLLGSNIGTTITAIISSVNSSRSAKRAALFHVVFNLIGSIAFIIFLNPFTSLIQLIENKFFTPYSSSTLATAHVIFNVTTTVVLAFFVKQLVWIVEKLIKPSEEEALVQSIDKLNNKLLDQAPVLALENARSVICDMSNIVEKMFNTTVEYIFTNNPKAVAEVNAYEDLIDTYDNKLHDYLTALSSKNLTAAQGLVHTIEFDTIRDLERIGDHLVNITEFVESRNNRQVKFHPESEQNVKTIVKLVNDMVKDSFKAYKFKDKAASRRVMSLEPRIDELEKKYRKAEIELFANGTITYNDIHYVDILSNLERIGDHANNIAENILNNSKHDVELNNN